jgi:ribonuclease P protein component
VQRDRRLRDNREFQHVYATGGSWPHPLCIMRAAPNGLDRSRFGFVVSKKVGGAVVRNRVKRRLREATRLMTWAEGYDVVVIARAAAIDASWADLNEALVRLQRRAGLAQAVPA